MNKEQALNFIENMYQDLLINFDVTKIEQYFSEDYFQITDGKKYNLIELTQSVKKLPLQLNAIYISDFKDIVFENNKIVVRCLATKDMKSGEKEQLGLVAIFEFGTNNKILRLWENTFPLSDK
ncbi:hypothetical protein FOL75_26550 [Bacillus thuringiensis]|uniref:hypothetical protein n=1 Tax=Bacillus cereus group TaxID=86661 RepID=UPI001C029277|nr:MULTISPECIES: hypothetical protein [Bacillus cereus group]MDR5025354.1 hypothetical protein [Bacillus thuringiensis]QWI47386.1 hypothetical protein EXW55_31735 [Bacillus mycoides]